MTWYYIAQSFVHWVKLDFLISTIQIQNKESIAYLLRGKKRVSLEAREWTATDFFLPLPKRILCSYPEKARVSEHSQTLIISYQALITKGWRLGFSVWERVGKEGSSVGMCCQRGTSSLQSCQLLQRNDVCGLAISCNFRRTPNLPRGSHFLFLLSRTPAREDWVQLDINVVIVRLVPFSWVKKQTRIQGWLAFCTLFRNSENIKHQ